MRKRTSGSDLCFQVAMRRKEKPVAVFGSARFQPQWSRKEEPMKSRIRLGFCALLALLLALVGCGGGGGGDGDGASLPTLVIEGPTSTGTYNTTATDVRVGGRATQAVFVEVTNTTTGYRTDASVTYFDGLGTWFVSVQGLVPGANVIVATADADGLSTRTASDTITVTRPLHPASLVLNAANAASSSNHWVDTSSFGSSHQITLYGDGKGRSTTGNALIESAGPVLPFDWTYDGLESITVSGCPTCSFQRISRISGATAEGGFYGQIETVGGAGETAVHFFRLSVGSL